MFIVDDDRTDGGTMHVDNGAVISSAQRKALPNNPDGWNDISIGWERNMTNYGIVRNFSLPLGFVLDGAKILRKIFLTENIERKLSILITQLSLKLTPTKFAYQYLFIYKGDLDLSTCQVVPNKVTINIMESGISKLLKANEGTVYELPLDDPDARVVYCDGITLFERVNFGVVDGITMSNPVNYFAMPFTEFNREGKSSGVYIQGQTFEPIGDLHSTSLDDYRHSSLNYFIQNTTDTPITVKLEGTIKYKFRSDLSGLLPGGPSPNVTLLVTSSIDGKLVDSVTFTGNLNDVLYSKEVSFTNTLDSKDENLFFILLISDHIIIGDGDHEVYDFEFYPDSEVHTSLETRFKASMVRMFTLYDCYRKLTGKITGDPDDAVSTLLANNLNMCITCGDAIRGFDGSKIKTKMTDFFKAVNVQFNAGMGIENNKVTIEEKAHYYNYSNPIPLGEVKSFPKITNATDLMANTFKIGSEAKDYTDINGRNEFNNTYLFSSPITRVVKEFSLLSPYRRDCYGFEYTRINFDGQKTTDSQGDNDIWIVNTSKGAPYSFLLLPFGTHFETEAPNLFKLPGNNLEIGTLLYHTDSVNAGEFHVVSVSNAVEGFTYVTVLEAVITDDNAGALYTAGVHPYGLRRGTYDVITGLLSPDTIFNIEDMTVARLIKKHSNWLHGMLEGFEGKELTFQTTEKNKLLYTQQGSVINEEAANVKINELAAPLFKPKYIEIEVKVPVNLTALLENNPAKCFSFTWHGKLYKGFLMKAGISISDNAQQVFKLLSSPDNDFSKLG